jgi:hypothetical protein
MFSGVPHDLENFDVFLSPLHQHLACCCCSRFSRLPYVGRDPGIPQMLRMASQLSGLERGHALYA